MRSRRRLVGALALIMLFCGVLGLMTGCEKAELSSGEDGKLRIVCTIFPQYDWTRQLLGDFESQADLVLLMKNGADMHSYQPTVWDMAAISDADLFIYVGGESDFWVEAALENAKNPDLKALNLLEILEDSILEEEHVEGMQEERGHDHEASPEEEQGQDHETASEAESGQEHESEYDEHIWLSLRNAVRSCEAIADALCELDKEHRAQYEQNEAVYVDRLYELDLEYREVTEHAARRTLLFGDRFPFRYLTEDYDLSYYAAFAGCSAETEASFGTITFLADKAAKLKLPVVLTIDGSDQRIARTIAENTRSDHRPGVRMLNSMQSVSEEDIKNGENYLSIMENNLEVLKEALPGTGR